MCRSFLEQGYVFPPYHIADAPICFPSQVYANNKAYVARHMKEHAAGKHTFTVALNKFADLTRQEFSSMFNGLKMDSNTPHKTYTSLGQEVPSSLDWRQHDVVTHVKQQIPCGSCWAFAAAGALESAWALAGNSLVPLSEHQLVDCSTVYGNKGCAGGYVSRAFQ